MSHGGNAKAKSNPELMLSIDALNHFQQRFIAGGGNQFSVEPPDQGLCVGKGFVLETVNDVLRVFDIAGNPMTAPTDLNSFYGYNLPVWVGSYPRSKATGRRTLTGHQMPREGASGRSFVLRSIRRPLVATFFPDWVIFAPANSERHSSAYTLPRFLQHARVSALLSQLGNDPL
jgi:hypothetical protein